MASFVVIGQQPEAVGLYLRQAPLYDPNNKPAPSGSAPESDQGAENATLRGSTHTPDGPARVN